MRSTDRNLFPRQADDSTINIQHLFAALPRDVIPWLISSYRGDSETNAGPASS